MNQLKMKQYLLILFGFYRFLEYLYFKGIKCILFQSELLLLQNTLTS